MSRRTIVCALQLSIFLSAAAADAQSLGTFRWQLQPFCNVVTVDVFQQGAVYTVDGYDDQCGAAQRAPLVGLATPNPDGTIGFGMNVVTVPGGRGVQIDARITLATLSGPWSDSAGNSGTFAINASTGGIARPLPTGGGGGTTIPPTFALQQDGGFLAGGALTVGAIPASGPGTRMMWFPNKAAFRAGNVSGTQWNDANVGDRSVAMGFNTVASGGLSTALGSVTTASGGNSTAIGAFTTANGGNSTAMGLETRASGSVSTALGYRTTASGEDASTAMGSRTTASGTSSTAMGGGTTASGDYSTAMGDQSRASGNYSVATGSHTVASGLYSTAMGIQTRASGDYSTAMGFRPTASGVSSTAMGVLTIAAGLGSTAMGTFAEASAAAPGSFVYGDRSTVATTVNVTSVAPNQFLVRAAGGVVFWSSPSTTYPTSPGVALNSNASAWSSLSDVNSKENFRDLSDEDVLTRMAQMPVREWNYKAQGSAIRHMGPTAQDFHAAFGLGEDSLRISTIDADGVALAGVKALEFRTRDLRDQGSAIRELVEALTRDNDELRARLSRLESLLEKR